LLPSADTSNIPVTQVILLFTMSLHMWQKSNKILLAIYGTVKFFCEDTTQSPASYAHNTTHTLALKLCHVMVCHLESSHCVSSKQY
jgi:hypothetical protein